MPAKVNRHLDISEELAALQARVLKLESFPGNGMTVLANASSNTPIGNISSTTNIYLSPATSGNFSLVRPVPLLVVAFFSFGTYSITTVETEAFAYVQLMGDSTDYALTNYAVVAASASGGIDSFILTPGYVSLLYTPTAGQIATTTNWSAQLWGHITTSTAPFQVYDWQITVFQLSG